MRMTFTFYVCLSLKPKAGHSPRDSILTTHTQTHISHINFRDFVVFFRIYAAGLLAIGFFSQPIQLCNWLGQEIRIRPGNYKLEKL